MASGCVVPIAQIALDRSRLIVNMPCQQCRNPIYLSRPFTKHLVSRHHSSWLFLISSSTTERRLPAWYEPLLAFFLRQFLFHLTRYPHNNAVRGERTFERWREAPESPALGLAGYGPRHRSYVSYDISKVKSDLLTVVQGGTALIQNAPLHLYL